MEKNFCQSCGAPLKADVRFCEECGAPVYGSHEAWDSGVKKVRVIERKGYLQLAIAAVVVIMLIALIRGKTSRNVISDVKDVIFDSYSSECSFGDAVQRSSLENVKWSYEKLGDNRYTVIMSAFYPKVYSNFDIAFDVNYTGKSVYAAVKYVSDGQERYSDWISVATIMSFIYG